MIFSSLLFLYLFLPLVLLIYFMSRNTTYRKITLILASLFFYAWGEPLWILVLISCAVANYGFALGLNVCRTPLQRKLLLTVSIILNLSVLGFFKYINFLIENLNILLSIDMPHSGIGLPIGISFFTFQTISYVVDVYRREVSAQKSLLNVLMYVSLFPQLIAGPIVIYKDIEQQLDNRSFNLSLFNEGVNRFLIGLGKKVILANTAGEVAEIFLDPGASDASLLGAWFGICLFALQIYFDFSGYSDMAIGLGKMFGFTYKENFNYPYISRSVSDFWRRWNITLGRFFRDYVYIPLGGNKRFMLRNLTVVWFLTGLWHGASWNFVLWGLYFGLFIILERAFLQQLLNQFPRWLSHAYLLFIVVVGWVLFYFTDLSEAMRHLRIMFGMEKVPFLNTEWYVHFTNHLPFFVILIVAATPALKKLHHTVMGALQSRVVLLSLYSNVFRSLFNLTLLLVSTIMLVGKTYNPFFYFRF